MEPVGTLSLDLDIWDMDWHLVCKISPELSGGVNCEPLCYNCMRLRATPAVLTVEAVAEQIARRPEHCRRNPAAGPPCSNSKGQTGHVVGLLATRVLESAWLRVWSRRRRQSSQSAKNKKAYRLSSPAGSPREGMVRSTFFRF